MLRLLLRFAYGRHFTGMWIVLEQFFRPPYTIMYMGFLSDYYLFSQLFLGIHLKRDLFHRVSGVNMLCDVIPTERNGVLVSTNLFLYRFRTQSL